MDINQSDEFQAVFLDAVRDGNNLLVETMLERGADANMRDKSRFRTPILAIACMEGRVAVAITLIRFGADINRIDQTENERESLDKFKSIVILTGAGISAESGIRTFRDQNGLWENHRIEDVASPEGFRRNPSLVHNFYNLRRRQLKEPTIEPNPAHLALAALEHAWEGDFLMITQNVDNLHERAGSKRLLHMHGELTKVMCESCNAKLVWDSDLSEKDPCQKCQRPALRPDIVWFGEMPYHMDTIVEALKRAEIFVSIGTSGLVYPAAGFAQLAGNAHRIEANLQESEISSHFDEHCVGPAGKEIPKLVTRLLA